MALEAGARIGHYEILGQIGAGGMGEVYRARDTKLDRDVAIKVLPAALAKHPDRLARFEREAKTLAALNHPNIAAIYGLEEEAIAMELVEGPTLADRLKAGPLAIEDALTIARQITDALEAAHERGIVHRDIKPANVKAPPGAPVKVLDFGLATAVQGPREASDAANSPTLTLGATEAGVILGTAAYMAPEQARGERVDKRADIWAFGVVLHEMLTGERLFKGATVSDTLASVLKDEVRLDGVPARVRGVVAQCLARDPKQRLRDIGDVWKFLGDVQTAAPAPAKPRRAVLPWAIAGAAAIGMLALGYVAYRHATEEPPHVAKLFFLAPEKSIFAENNGPPAVSPDGRRIVFRANIEGKGALWVRDLDSAGSRLLPGTEGALGPFWSSDSRWVAFGASGKLKKIDVAGGPALTLCDAPQFRLGAWNKDDVIVFAPNTIGALFRVPAAGGTPAPVTELDKARGEVRHHYPWFLPDGRHFLYTAMSSDAEKSAVFVGDLDSKERTQVVATRSSAVYAAPGYLLFLRERTLMAQPFDAGKLRSTGEAVPLAEQVDVPDTAAGIGYFSVSENGVLAYASGVTGNALQITWFDRSGKALGTVGRPVDIGWAALAPDGKTVATDRRDSQSGNRDIWLHDSTRGTEQRLTFNGQNQYPVWSPDGVRISFEGARGSSRKLYAKAANGVGQEEVLSESPATIPMHWSRDGRYLVALTPNTIGKSGNDIWMLPLSSADLKAEPLIQTEFSEVYPKLSPDGRWLAYQSNESKTAEVYVVTFPKSGGKWQISVAGGRIPVWSRDGRELYYVSLDNKMMAVEIKPGTQFSAGVPKPLFDVRLGTNNPNFDVGKDGRFLIATPTEQAADVPMTVVLNWPELLKRK